MITLYTVDCPRCKVLEEELVKANIPFKVCNDTKIMLNLGMKEVPCVQIESGAILDFKQAVKWIKDMRSEEDV